MADLNIALFGKHPAWSDHMYLAASEAHASRLKRAFYDHAMISALQGTEDASKRPESWSVIAFVDGQAYLIASVPSLDSVGRTRFPLFAACLLPHNLPLAEAAHALRLLSGRLRDLLEDLLVPPSDDDQSAWQQSVAARIEKFDPNTSFGDVSPHSEPEIKVETLANLLAHLSEERYSLDLGHERYDVSIVLALAALAQFESSRILALILDSDFTGEALLIANEPDHGLRIDHYLRGILPRFQVPRDRVPVEVNDLLESAGYDILPLSNIPSLRISGSSNQKSGSLVNKKHILFAAVLALVGALLIGLILLAMGTGTEGESPEGEVMTAQGSFPAREAWIRGASDYVEWIQPLEGYLENNPDIFQNQRLADALKLEHNPFSVVNRGKVEKSGVKNPMDRWFRKSNMKELEGIYANIEELRGAFAEYFEKKNPAATLEEIEGTDYELPPYLSDLIAKTGMRTPEFGEAFLDGLRDFRRIREYLEQVESLIDKVESGVVRPMEKSFPVHAGMIRRHMEEMLAGAQTHEAFQDESRRFLEALAPSEFPEISEVNAEALSENKEWRNMKERASNDQSIRSLVQVVQDHVVVEESQFTALTASLNTANISLQTEVDVVRTDFPSLNLDDAAIKSVQESVLETLDAINSARRISKSYTMLDDRASSLLEQMSELRDSIETRHQQSADPGRWLQVVEEEFGVFETPVLVEWTREYLEGLKSDLVSQEDFNPIEGYRKFRSDVDVLLESCKLVDTAFKNESGRLYEAYLNQESGRKRIHSYMADELAQAQNRPGTAAQFKKLMQGLSDAVELEIERFSNRGESLEVIWTSMDVADTPPEQLRRAIRAHLELPLYLEDVFTSRLRLLEDAASGKPDMGASVEDLFWVIETLIEENRLTAGVLSQATKAYLAMRSGAREKVLGPSLRRAFDLFAGSIGTEKIDALLKFYRDLEQYLPAELQRRRDRDLSEIAEHWARYSEQSEALPSREDLARLQAGARSPLLERFYEEMMAVREKADELAGKTSLENLANASKMITRFEYDRQNSTIDVVLQDDGAKLRFHAVRTDSGTIFVQDRPLTLWQYIQVAEHSGSGADLYPQDGVRPRAHGITPDGGGFTAYGKWQFDPGKPFSALAGFPRAEIPAHINQPAVILDLAQMLGFRLLKRDEVPGFLKMESLAPRAAIELSSEDKRLLDEYGTTEHSVYQKEISALRSQKNWNGGLDFERDKESKQKLTDVFGGSAELVYEDDAFYAFGGSWLYMPDSPEKLIPIQDPEKSYIDLGARFVFDAPAPSYAELIERVGRELLVE